jgi:hypothetical protein
MPCPLRFTGLPPYAHAMKACAPDNLGPVTSLAAQLRSFLKNATHCLRLHRGGASASHAHGKPDTRRCPGMAEKAPASRALTVLYTLTPPPSLPTPPTPHRMALLATPSYIALSNSL